jgi:hypothetical protein
MATSIDTSRLGGFFKDRFGGDAEILPDEGYDVLSKRIAFDESLKLGEKVSEPVMVQDELGWTFAGGATTGTMFALNDANSGLTVEATWTRQEFVTRARTSWKTLRAAQDSKQAFGNAYDKIVRSMKRGAVFAREYSMLFGGASLGRIESVSGSGTTRTWTLTKADTSAGFWWPLKGVLVDGYSAESSGTLRNTLADMQVTAIDLNASSGKVELLVSGNDTDLTAVVANDYILPKGANANMMTGIDAVATNTGSYAGISASTYPFWKSTSLNAGAAQATFSKFLQALRVNRLKSGPGKRIAIISEATAQDIGDNAAALQRTMKGGGKLELGSDTIVYHSLGGHLIEFLPHVLQKEGCAHLVDFDEISRIGSTDLTFDPTGKGEFFEHVPGYAGLELIAYWDQGLRVANPASITKITSIANTY